ncbi:mitochondrial 37S ribosomal protein nam9, partial [Nowakowskiella sp. JEL0078]
MTALEFDRLVKKVFEMPPKRPRILQPYDKAKAIFRMSWNKQNTLNLAATGLSQNTREELRNARRSVYQQRWEAKRLVRSYHFPNITESQFLSRHFETVLPLQQIKSKKLREAIPPIQTLMFAEMERRVDVVIFRSHFAKSIFNARSIVNRGYVLINGEKCIDPFHRLREGDLVTVHPNVIPTLSHNAKYPKFTSDNSFATFRSERPSTRKAPERTSGESTENLNNLPAEFREREDMKYYMYIPEYLEVNYATCTVAFLRSPLPQPNKIEIPTPFPPRIYQLAFEWYATIQRRKTVSRIHDRQKRTILRMSRHIPRVIRLKPRFKIMVTKEWRARRSKHLKEMEKRE